MVKFELGEFAQGIPYLKIGEGSKKVVVFPETEELICAFVKDPKKLVQEYSLLLPKDYTIYALGYNPNMPADETPFTIVDRVAPFIRQHIGKAVVAGISYGGPNALSFAARHPDLVSKLLIIVSAYKVSDTTGKQFIAEAIRLAQQEDHYGVARLMISLCNNLIINALQKIMLNKNRKKLAEINNPLSTLITAYKATFVNMIDDFKALLPKIQAPTYVFGGTKDKCFGEKEFRETADLIPNGHAIIFKGGGHLVALEHYFQFKRKFLEVLRKEDE